MGLRINNNIEAFNTHRSVVSTSNALSKSMAKLSSGFRINSAADDASGLGISERMRSQIRGLGQAQRNVQDGISFVQSAEGSMQEITSILQRVRELAVQYGSGTTGASGQYAITTEVAQLSAEVTRIISSATFNGIALLCGSTNVTFQVGANSGEVLAVAGANVPNAIASDISTWFPTGASTAMLTAADAAINAVSALRGTLGAVQNRLEYTNDSIGIAQENYMAAESRIRDVDMASEMANYTKLQILQQSGMAMLAQANTMPQSILSLLK